ncbi:hypothetical protein [Hydrogenophaga atypica]|uniref:Uncharacterized protein n=1 Tax=Hydrogenophaga atypica TaxID=249409 RepID=A0ABW2QQP7_9BURK
MNTNTVATFAHFFAAVQGRTPRREWPPPTSPGGAVAVGSRQP